MQQPFLCNKPKPTINVLAARRKSTASDYRMLLYLCMGLELIMRLFYEPTGFSERGHKESVLPMATLFKLGIYV